jgi:hypothetical protein
MDARGQKEQATPKKKDGPSARGELQDILHSYPNTTSDDELLAQISDEAISSIFAVIASAAKVAYHERRSGRYAAENSRCALFKDAFAFIQTRDELDRFLQCDTATRRRVVKYFFGLATKIEVLAYKRRQVNAQSRHAPEIRTNFDARALLLLKAHLAE